MPPEFIFFNHRVKKDFIVTIPDSLYQMFTVIGGPSSPILAKKISKKLGAKYIQSSLQVFPDGESKLTLDEQPKKGKIIVVQSTPPPVNSNLMRALSLVYTARLYSEQVIAVVPYLGYARQDMEFLKGEVVSSQLVANLFSAAGATKLITVDIHSKLALNYFTIPVENTTAKTKLALFLKKLDLKNPVVVSPDYFWSGHAQALASLLGTTHMALNKHRDRKTGKIYLASAAKLDLGKKDVILFDDMISTGGSMALAATYLKNQNCGKIYGACTHALLVGDARTRLKKAGVKKIISTNTVEPGLVDVSDVISQVV